MKIIKKYCKKSNSWLHFDFVAHDGFGLKPRLKIRFIDRSGLYFYFLFTFWRFEIYRVEPKKIINYEQSMAEKFIEDYAMNCSNEMALENKDGSKLYYDWLTPEDAKIAVGIAREEIYKWLLNHNDYITVNGNTTSYDMEKLVKDLKQAMKDE